MKLSQQKRLDLIKAAKEEFTEFGFHAANMDRVCERAGTSKRTLYRHFVSKELLFLEVIKASVLQLDHFVFEYQTHRPITEQLQDYLVARTEVLYQKIGIDVIGMIIREFIRDPSLTQQYITLIGDQDDELRVWLNSAIQDGQLIDKDVSIMTKLLVNLFHGQFLWPQLLAAVAFPDTEQRKRMIDEIIRVFVTSYAVQ